MPGVYEDWPSAQAQITGWVKPKYKSFISRSEAEAFVSGVSLANGTSGSTTASAGPAQIEEKGPSKKQKKSKGVVEEITLPALDENGAYLPGEDPLPADTADGFDPRIVLDPETGELEYKTDEQLNKTKWQATTPAGEGMLRIYTDGSSLGNGATGAVAGVGVYFGPSDRRYV